MTTRERPADVGAADARRLGGKAGAEVKVQRLTLGISQEQAASRAGVSESAYARFERGELSRPTLDRICRAARAVGLAPSLSFYPTGEPIRDAAQLALLARFEALLAPPLRLRREVPLPIERDLRAWDGRVSDGSRTASIEGESKLYDAQAIARRIALKARDDPYAGVVILVVNQTGHNRRILAAHREALRGQFPLDGGAIARALRAGTVPAVGGIILL
jgi:transcriptional regulator with XRE-family HTH domain